MSDLNAARDKFKAIIDIAEQLSGLPVGAIQLIELAKAGLQALDDQAAMIATPVPIAPGFVWPTDFRPVYITQFFLANPQNYARFGLPGHEGIDIRTSTTGQILAIYPGKVYVAERNAASGPYGIHVRIEHQLPDGSILHSMYAHQSQLENDIQIGAMVEGGHVLGLCGKTGNAPAIHLHLTLKNDRGEFVDPLTYMAKAYQAAGGLQSLPAVKASFATKKQ